MHTAKSCEKLRKAAKGEASEVDGKEIQEMLHYLGDHGAQFHEYYRNSTGTSAMSEFTGFFIQGEERSLADLLASLSTPRLRHQGSAVDFFSKWRRKMERKKGSEQWLCSGTVVGSEFASQWQPLI